MTPHQATRSVPPSFAVFVRANRIKASRQRREQNERFLAALESFKASQKKPIERPPVDVRAAFAGYELGRAFAQTRPAKTKNLSPLPSPSGQKQAAQKLHPMLKLGLSLGGLYLGYRVVQSLSDEVFEGRTLPKNVRDALKFEHLEEHGEYCPCCDGYASFSDLVIDHIIPYALGGLTSIANSQVICRSCNSSKGANVTLGERLRGRGGREDY